ncbi:MAG: phenylalanine--tRNA ligase subunit beta, partial [Burkholderiales bacterium]|nr:phenylalanine--tRNA ligase subunit beta [Burkholderiales bacterium]
ANEEMESIFARLKLPARREGAADAEAFVVTPPSWRFDLEIEEDLIEEVARLWGFERIPAVPPQAPAAMLPVTEKRRSVHGLRTLLAALGYHEVINFGFVDAEGERDMAGNAAPIAVRNPIASQLSVMRTLLIPGLVANLRYNINRKSNRVRVFEIGRVFLRDATQPDGPLTVAGIRQPVRLAGASIGTLDQEQWGAPSRSVDFFDAKGDVEALLAPRSAQFQPAVHPALHPGRSARVVLDGVDIGWVGELHPRWQQKLDLPGAVQVFELDAEALQTVDLPIYREVSRFPPVRRDLSFEVAEEVPVESILQALRSGLPPVVEAVELFDLYRGKGVSEGKKSLAIRVLFQDTQKTLTDAEVHEMMDSARFILQQRFDAHLRQ